MDAMEKLLARDTLADWARARRAALAPLVFTNGVFDLLHLGHVRYLRHARSLGGALLVGVNSDASTQRLKGPGRPLVPAIERAEVLAGLSCVDAVSIFDEATATALVDVLRPDIYVKGGDYGGPDERGTLRFIGPDVLRRLAPSANDALQDGIAQSKGRPDADQPALSRGSAASAGGAGMNEPPADLFARLPEARAVARYGGSICLIPYVAGHSTSELIERIVRLNGA